MELVGIKLRAAFAQFQAISPSRRLAIAAVAVLILASLWLVIRSSSDSASGEYLYGGREFSRDELLAIETAFGEASLEDWRVVGYRVEVPAERRAQYLAALGSQKLLFGLERPSEEEGIFGFGAGREMRYKREKQQKMARVIGGMPGIAEVAVEYTESKANGFPRKSEKRAVVAVKAVGGRHLDQQEITAIRKAIVGSEAGLPPDSVAVLDINAKRTYDGSTDSSTSSTPQSLLVAQERLYEDQLQQKILNRLVNYRGLVVEVNAQASVVPASTADLSQARCVAQAVAVSIGVPSSYYERLWKQRQHATGADEAPPPSRQQLAAIEAETLRKVEEIVGGLLNEVDLPAGRQPKVVVRTDEDFAAVDQQAPRDATRFWKVLSQRGRPLIIALVALALVVGWLALSWKKRPQAANNVPLDVPSQPPTTARRATEESGEEYKLRERETAASLPSTELQTQLSQLVQQDPDAAVDALRKWIKKVA